MDYEHIHSTLAFMLLKVAVSYQTLDVLQEHGIAVNDIQKLNAAGFYTIESVRLGGKFVYRHKMKNEHSHGLLCGTVDCSCHDPKAFRGKRDIGSQGVETKRACQIDGSDGLQDGSRCPRRSQVSCHLFKSYHFALYIFIDTIFSQSTCDVDHWVGGAG
jgi:hypothetical protein